jgi:hypothetical protein
MVNQKTVFTQLDTRVDKNCSIQKLSHFAVLLPSSVLEPHELPALETILPLPSLLRNEAPMSEHVVLGARLSSLRLGPAAETLHLLQQRYRGGEGPVRFRLFTCVFKLHIATYDPTDCTAGRSPLPVLHVFP